MLKCRMAPRRQSGLHSKAVRSRHQALRLKAPARRQAVPASKDPAEIDLSELAPNDVIRFTTITDDSGNVVIDTIFVMGQLE